MIDIARLRAGGKGVTDGLESAGGGWRSSGPGSYIRWIEKTSRCRLPAVQESRFLGILGPPEGQNLSEGDRRVVNQRLQGSSDSMNFADWTFQARCRSLDCRRA